MYCRPVPERNTCRIPPPGASGSFPEERGDRHPCGIAICTEADGTVPATASGTAEKIEASTSQERIPCSTAGFAGPGSVAVAAGVRMQAGMPLGPAGSVPNPRRIDATSSPCTRSLEKRGTWCMLHREVYADAPTERADCRGGTGNGRWKPDPLTHPAVYLRAAGGSDSSRSLKMAPQEAGS
ncbi:MAG: hypothetical protein QMD46_13015 [Methanomicrobiales archaeon]|nr:hypothetical protein [Methanomicrobiales archaeon]MDI6876870.1 hypothetical protein [Methanomicrobiales archaeon]